MLFLFFLLGLCYFCCKYGNKSCIGSVYNDKLWRKCCCRSRYCYCCPRCIFHSGSSARKFTRKSPTPCTHLMGTSRSLCSPRKGIKQFSYFYFQRDSTGKFLNIGGIKNCIHRFRTGGKRSHNIDVVRHSVPELSSRGWTIQLYICLPEISNGLFSSDGGSIHRRSRNFKCWCPDVSGSTNENFG